MIDSSVMPVSCLWDVDSGAGEAYDSAVAELIRFKLGDREVIDRFAAGLVARFRMEYGSAKSGDWVILQRRFRDHPLNHSRSLLEEEVARRLEVGIVHAVQWYDLVEWAGMEVSERLRIANEIVELEDRAGVRGRRILAVDDVWVSGALTRFLFGRCDSMGARWCWCFAVYDARRNSMFEWDCYRAFVKNSERHVRDCALAAVRGTLTHTAAKFLLRMAVDDSQRFGSILEGSWWSGERNRRARAELLRKLVIVAEHGDAISHSRYKYPMSGALRVILSVRWRTDGNPDVDGAVWRGVPDCMVSGRTRRASDTQDIARFVGELAQERRSLRSARGGGDQVARTFANGWPCAAVVVVFALRSSCDFLVFDDRRSIVDSEWEEIVRFACLVGISVANPVFGPVRNDEYAVHEVCETRRLLRDIGDLRDARIVIHGLRDGVRRRLEGRTSLRTWSTEERSGVRAVVGKFADDLRAAVRGICEEVGRKFPEMAQGMSVAVVGSVARGEPTVESDVDLMLVVRDEGQRRTVAEKIAPLLWAWLRAVGFRMTPQRRVSRDVIRGRLSIVFDGRKFREDEILRHALSVVESRHVWGDRSVHEEAVAAYGPAIRRHADVVDSVRRTVDRQLEYGSRGAGLVSERNFLVFCVDGVVRDIKFVARYFCAALREIALQSVVEGRTNLDLWREGYGRSEALVRGLFKMGELSNSVSDESIERVIAACDRVEIARHLKGCFVGREKVAAVRGLYEEFEEDVQVMERFVTSEVIGRRRAMRRT